MTRPNALFGKFASIVIVLAITNSLFAQSPREKLDAALLEFEEITSQIANEKLPLTKRINQKRTENATLRAEIETLLLGQTQSRNQVDQSQQQGKAIASQLDFTESLLIEHNTGFENSLSAAEDQRYRKATNDTRKEISDTAALTSRIKIIDLSLQRINDKLQSPNFQGEAIASDGSVVTGLFANLGPVTYFLSEDKITIGQAVSKINSLLPAIETVPKLTSAAIESLAKNQPVSIPLDPTLGKAREVAQAQWTLADQIEKGGEVGYIILVFAFVTICVGVFKTVQFSRTRISDTLDYPTLLTGLSNNDSNQANALAKAQPHHSIPFLLTIVHHYHDAYDIIEERLLGHLDNAKRRLEGLLPILAIIATTAPLLGLLGTVVGMIKTFALINVYGSGEAKAFSAGISEALVTTEFGLVVAIPALILHGFLKRQANKQLGLLEDFASDLMVALRAKRENPPSKHD